LFARVAVPHPGVAVATLLLAAAVFSLAGFINAVCAKKFDDISIVPTFVLAPLTYLGGVFYSVDMLPDGFRGVSMANPVLYMVNAFRHGLLGISDVPLALAFAVMLAFTVVLVALALWLLHRGVGLRS